MAVEIISELKRLITNLAYKLERQSIEYVARELHMVSGILSEVSMEFEDSQIDHAMQCLSSASDLMNIMLQVEVQQQTQGESFGVQPTYVYGKTGRPKTEKPLSQLEVLIECNFKQKDIAELFGISVRTLRTMAVY
ncbi:hypothetical protein SNE40_012910 [Patella caerulea]|uniref:Uncharacterized protein n=1 Tax=Patella caerulea TaxID=87958 RepID=A0AAN8PKC2_PATCE